MRRYVFALAIALVSLEAGAGAVQTNVDLPAVDEALRFTRSGTPSEWETFHRPYHVTSGNTPVDYLEVITPYRRIVLEGASRRLMGDRSFGQREALEMLKEAGPTLDVSAELTFHPLNTFIGVPDYRIELVQPDGRRSVPVEVFRRARWTARRDGQPSAVPGSSVSRPGGATMLGATIVGRFALEALNASGVYDVEVWTGTDTRVRVSIALGGMR